MLDAWVEEQAKTKGLGRLTDRREKKGQFEIGTVVDEVISEQSGQLQLQRSLLEDEAVRVRAELLAGLDRVASQVSSHAYVLQTGRIVMAGDSKKLRADPQLKATYLGG